jgi:hypothetical protein
MSATASCSNASAFATRFSTQETIYSANVPQLIVPSLAEVIVTHARYHAQHPQDRVLVHRMTTSYQGQNYTVDYLTTNILGVWHEYTVVYLEGEASPFPHTIDLRFGPVENAPAAPVCSSSNFRAAAMAMMAARR